MQNFATSWCSGDFIVSMDRLNQDTSAAIVLSSLEIIFPGCFALVVLRLFVFCVLYIVPGVGLRVNLAFRGQTKLLFQYVLL